MKYVVIIYRRNIRNFC